MKPLLAPKCTLINGGQTIHCPNRSEKSNPNTGWLGYGCSLLDLGWGLVKIDICFWLFHRLPCRSSSWIAAQPSCIHTSVAVPSAYSSFGSLQPLPNIFPTFPILSLVVVNCCRSTLLTAQLANCSIGQQLPKLAYRVYPLPLAPMGSTGTCFICFATLNYTKAEWGRRSTTLIHRFPPTLLVMRSQLNHSMDRSSGRQLDPLTHDSTGGPRCSIHESRALLC